MARSFAPSLKCRLRPKSTTGFTLITATENQLSRIVQTEQAGNVRHVPPGESRPRTPEQPGGQRGARTAVYFVSTGSSATSAMRLLRATPLVALLMLLCAVEIRGHGRLRVPPSRGSMWREGFNTPINYNDNELFCGGAWYQNGLNGGKCGICGDPWGKPNPEYEAGGKYANGIITRTYTEGQEIGIAVEVTAQHGGWFEFRICPNNDVTTPATHECLNRNLLPLADGTGSRMYLQIDDPVGFYNTTLRLPRGLSCTQCVLQWKWHTGNSWGTDEDGLSCIGCGAQEEFYGCADVAIRTLPVRQDAGVVPPASDLAPPASDLAPPASSPAPPASDLAPPASSPAPPASDLAPPASDLAPPVAPQNPQPETTQRTLPPAPAQAVTTSQSPDVAAPTAVSAPGGCVPADGYEGDPNMERWCRQNCVSGSTCPAFMCRCGLQTGPRKVCKTTDTGPWKNANLDVWCARVCGKGICPSSHCMCVTVPA
ncbi:hypothetical protein LSAT2_017807 [Lamellibrachia satsuma]|nr:hypothetical protein LSAT2_017807 [Lamellibrachia satsuma]